jgi:hypothetical protein
MKKYLFLVLKIRCGEYEFYSKSVHQLPADTTPEAFAQTQAQEFYGDRKNEFADGGYYANGGEVHTSVDTYRAITPHEYRTLKRFL